MCQRAGAVSNCVIVVIIKHELVSGFGKEMLQSWVVEEFFVLRCIIATIASSSPPRAYGGVVSDQLRF